MRWVGCVWCCLLGLHAFADEKVSGGWSVLGEDVNLLVAPDFQVNAITAVHQNPGYWLAASEKTGVLKITQDRNVVRLFPGKYAYIDSVHLAGQNLVASYNTELQQVEIFYQGDKFALESVNFNINGLCMYLSPDKNVFLYLLDGFGGTELRWVYQGRQRKVVDKRVKTIGTAPGVESCKVNLSTQELFFTEKDLGLWRYAAPPETPPSRQLLLYRTNGSELKNIALYRDQLFVAEDQKISHYRFAAEAGGSPALQLRQSWYVGVDRDAGGLAVLANNHTAKLAYVDDKSRAVFLIEFSVDSEFYQTVRSIPAVYPVVEARAETSPMDRRGDTAFDPAIWYHQKSPKNSRIVVTNTRYGILVYGIDGQLRQSLPVGHVSTIDIRQTVLSGGQTWDIAAATNRSDNSLQLFSISKKGRVAELAKIPTALDEVHGLCLYRHSSEKLFAFIHNKDGRMQQYLLSAVGDGFRGQLVATYTFTSQPKDCVADDSGRQLFLSEKNRGVRRFKLDVNSGELQRNSAKMIAKVDNHLHDDIGGMALYVKGRERYLLVSSRRDNSYAVFQAVEPFKYVNSFRVGLNSNRLVDGTAGSDGIDVSSLFFNQNYAAGMLIIHDGVNIMPEQPQNFKLVPWGNVAKILENRSK